MAAKVPLVPRLRRLALAVPLAAALLAAPQADADSYMDDAYREFDLDNITRSLQRQTAMLSDPEFQADFAATALESQVENVSDQAREVRNGRVYAGLGQVLPGGSVGDPTEYHEVATTEVNFLFRSGAKLEGHLFAPVAGPTPAPAVVITTGSIQGTQHMYWWAARALARAGYVVFTWDVQGQGESEATPHAPGQVLPFVDPDSAEGITTEGVPFQQAFNFHEGTIDALRFFTSTPDEPYVPGGWSAEDDAASRAGHDPGSEPIDRFNPLWGLWDRSSLGIAGHSLGAGAVSAVQQCSDRRTRWQEIVDFCTRSFPIDAVVGWDRLNTGSPEDPYVPVVPGMDQQADGYFLNPEPTTDAPDLAAQRSRVDGGAFAAWRAAGQDAYTFTVRGGLHSEWTEVPYILPATSYGVDMAEYYTVAWMDRYVHPDRGRRAAAFDRLRLGPIPTAAERNADVVQPWRANLMSARFAGAYSLRGVRPGAGPAALADAVDLRVLAGLTPVGDWAGANADRPAVEGG